MLQDGKGRSFALDDVEIPEDSYVALPYAVTGIPLVNGGGTLFLVAPDGGTIDVVTYPTAPTGSSFARTTDGTWDWTPNPTPGDVNSFPTTPTDDASGETDANDGGTTQPIDDAPTQPEDETPTQPTGDAPPPDPSLLSVTEFMPNPVGSDDLEWIELHNAGTEPFPLGGWSLDDDEGGSAPYVFDAEYALPPGDALIPRATSGLALNNTGDRVRLIAPDGNVHVDVPYGAAEEGASYALIGDEWRWTSTPTPGEPNPVPSNDDIAPTDDGGATDDGDASGDSGADPGTDDGAADGSDGADDGSEAVITDIESLDGLADGETATVRAVTTFVPGDIGKTILGLQDATGALIARLYGDLPEAIPHGALIEAEGKVKRTEGVVRLSVKTGSVKILEEDALVPVETTVAALTRDDEGANVVLQGTVTDARKTWFMLTDDGARTEVRIDLDKAWPTDLIATGNDVRVTGTVRVTGGTIRVIPRTRGDVEMIDAEPTAEATTPATPEGTDDASTTATIDAATTEDPNDLPPPEPETPVAPALGVAGATVAGATTVAVTRKKRRTSE